MSDSVVDLLLFLRLGIKRFRDGPDTAELWPVQSIAVGAA